MLKKIHKAFEDTLFCASFVTTLNLRSLNVQLAASSGLYYRNNYSGIMLPTWEEGGGRGNALDGLTRGWACIVLMLSNGVSSCSGKVAYCRFKSSVSLSVGSSGCVHPLK